MADPRGNDHEREAGDKPQKRNHVFTKPTRVHRQWNLGQRHTALPHQHRDRFAPLDDPLIAHAAGGTKDPFAGRGWGGCCVCLARSGVEGQRHGAFAVGTVHLQLAHIQPVGPFPRAPIQKRLRAVEFHLQKPVAGNCFFHTRR
jgi:hypothetical protein